MDRFGLQKLLQKATQNNIDVGDKVAFAVIVKEAQWIEAATESMETAARKIGVAIRRGSEPDAKAYTETRDKLVAKSRKLQDMLGKFGNTLAATEKASKKAGDTKTAKLLAEIDKQLDGLEDILADHKKLPSANEIILGLLGGQYKIAKPEEKGKEGPVKRSLNVDDATPGSSFLAEVQWTVKNVPSLVMKSVVKHEKAIKDLDLVTQNSKRYQKDAVDLDDFVKTPSAQPDTKLRKLAEDLTALIAAADKARKEATVVGPSLRKLVYGTPREKSAVESLTKYWASVEKVVDDAWKDLTSAGKSGQSPLQRYNDAVERARKASAKQAATAGASPAAR